MNRIELLWSRTRAGPGAQAGERVLELARERGVPGADVRLHLLEGEVRIERDLVGAQHHRRVQLAPHGGERRGRRRGLVPLSLGDRKSTRLNSSHLVISYAVFCLKKKNNPRS